MASGGTGIGCPDRLPEADRLRLSRERIGKFLADWLGLQLAVGTIHNTLQESGAAALPIAEELIQAVRESTLLHADETSWTELSNLFWLGRSSARAALRLMADRLSFFGAD